MRTYKDIDGNEYSSAKERSDAEAHKMAQALVNTVFGYKAATKQPLPKETCPMLTYKETMELARDIYQKVRIPQNVSREALAYRLTGNETAKQELSTVMGWDELILVACPDELLKTKLNK